MEGQPEPHLGDSNVSSALTNAGLKDKSKDLWSLKLCALYLAKCADLLRWSPPHMLLPTPGSSGGTHPLPTPGSLGGTCPLPAPGSSGGTRPLPAPVSS